MARNFELLPPKKKKCNLKSGPPLPISRKFCGIFNGFSVDINNEESMKDLIKMGNFGKATLSRSYPQFRPTPEIIRERVFENRKKIKKQRPKKIIVVPDSDDSDPEYEKYFEGLKPRFEIDYSNIKEICHLSLEESFFLNYALNCLEIYRDNQLIEHENLWKIFNENQFFAHNYIVYYYYRTKKWVVKPGLKYGGDFLLYKEGPAFYHASYIIIIDVVDKNFERIPEYSRRSMDHTSILCLNRLCENAGKELLICQIQQPSEIDYKDLSNITIKEIIVRRWLSNQERQLNQQ